MTPTFYRSVTILSLTKPLTRILLKKHSIIIFNKPLKILQQGFPSRNKRPTNNNQTNVVYKINCKDCPWNMLVKQAEALKRGKKNVPEIVNHIKI